MKLIKTKENYDLYQVSYQDGFKIKSVKIHKKNLYSDLKIKHLAKKNRYGLEKLIFNDGFVKGVSRKVKKSGNKIEDTLYNRDILVKELNYFSKNFKNIFEIDLLIPEYLQSHFWEIDYWMYNIQKNL